VGKGTFKAYEKGEWVENVVRAWGVVKPLLSGEVGLFTLKSN
jgi:hypothetical protein